MSAIPHSGTRRERLGKGGARKSRATGQIPGVLYGHGEIPIPLQVDARAFELALHHHEGANPLVSLSVDGGDYTALIRDVQYDPISHDILHLDFQHISLTETVEVQVAVHVVGLAAGVKDGGGILETITRHIEVRCLPTAIPSSVDVDVSHLGVGDSVHVRDLVVPNVTVLTDPNATVATVVAPTVIEEKPVEEVAAAPAAEEPEVIAKGKKEEVEEAAAGKEGREENKGREEKKEERKEKK